MKKARRCRAFFMGSIAMLPPFIASFYFGAFDRVGRPPVSLA